MLARFVFSFHKLTNILIVCLDRLAFIFTGVFMVCTTSLPSYSSCMDIVFSSTFEIGILHLDLQPVWRSGDYQWPEICVDRNYIFSSQYTSFLKPWNHMFAFVVCITLISVWIGDYSSACSL